MTPRHCSPLALTQNDLGAWKTTRCWPHTKTCISTKFPRDAAGPKLHRVKNYCSKTKTIQTETSRPESSKDQNRIFMYHIAKFSAMRTKARDFVCTHAALSPALDGWLTHTRCSVQPAQPMAKSVTRGRVARQEVLVKKRTANC